MEKVEKISFQEFLDSLYRSLGTFTQKTTGWHVLNAIERLNPKWLGVLRHEGLDPVTNHKDIGQTISLVVKETETYAGFNRKSLIESLLKIRLPHVTKRSEFAEGNS